MNLLLSRRIDSVGMEKGLQSESIYFSTVVLIQIYRKVSVHENWMSLPLHLRNDSDYKAFLFVYSVKGFFISLSKRKRFSISCFWKTKTSKK